jgi:mannosyltransferase OCH1-like enzyme
MSTIVIPNYLKPLVPYKFKVHIPRIIHQTYKSLKSLPQHWKEVPESWKRNNEEWTYMFWSDDDCRNLVKTRFPTFLPLFDSYEYPIQRADAIRPMIMHTYGGIYCDMDMFCKKPIDDLFYEDSEVYLLRTPNAGIITNCCMASKPKSSFWLHVIDLMKENITNPSSLWVGKHMFVMNTTGPVLLQSAYDSYPIKNKFKFLPQSSLFPEECNVCCPKPCTTKESYVVVLQGSSWCGEDTALLTLIYCNYGKILTIVAFLFIVLVIYKYWYLRVASGELS